MTVFTEHLVESNRDLWMAMAGHPFVLGLADGTLPDGALQAWVQQDRIFVVEERRVGRAPRLRPAVAAGRAARRPGPRLGAGGRRLHPNGRRARLCARGRALASLPGL